MATRVMIVGTPTGRGRFYEMMQDEKFADEFRAAAEKLNTPDGDDLEFEFVETPPDGDDLEFDRGELHRSTFVLSCPDRDLAPCKPMDFDDRYTGKCKKLRKEARGW